MAAPGHNTVHGYDTGPPPPGFGFGGQYPGFYAPPHMPGYNAPPPQYMVPPQMPMPPFNMGGQMMAGATPNNHGFPGLTLKNGTGGSGYPGYYYLFPQQHCQIHVFKTKTKPWQMTAYSHDNSTHIKIVVPVTMSLKELMQNLGLKNDSADKNILYEVVEAGNGKWTSGLKIKGGDKDRMKKSIGDMGWNADRSGIPGKNPVVWLWVTDEGL